jgi:hypothetical protein
MLPVWIQRLLGGRPMVCLGPDFRDVVSGRVVYQFIDCRGRLFMANDRWGWGRVRCGRETCTVEQEPTRHP